MIQIPDAAVQALEALKKAEMFIENGVEYGFIRLPEKHDPALDTLPKIKAAIEVLTNDGANPVDAPTKEERHANKARNIIINQTSDDLENIINGHDPEQSILNNDVWDRLDKMACEIEALAKPVDVAAVREAFKLGWQSSETANVEDTWEDTFAYHFTDAHEIRALSAEPAQGEQWQPIETAPKDGTVILAWHITHKCPISVLWKDDGFPYQGERLNWLERTYTSSWPERAFSHWMPLPTKPERTAA